MKSRTAGRRGPSYRSPGGPVCGLLLAIHSSEPSGTECGTRRLSPQHTGLPHAIWTPTTPLNGSSQNYNRRKPACLGLTDSSFVTKARFRDATLAGPPVAECASVGTAAQPHSQRAPGVKAPA
ncbi:hypothetical protein DPEC_G00345900 [Dallia pectoralis]|uniref:Uncharacterized protein n=1 Tax=Dallia pectoralis TaxID=75939 RepID=A0ACC2F3M2_DALPE|nr:hypothetical protein DPEC_G00345900 [Dallia pectoralis]